VIDAAVQRAVREVVNAANERRKWNALGPSVSTLERATAAVFRGQAADVRKVLAVEAALWPAQEAAVPDRFAEFIARVLHGRQGRDGLRLAPPLGAAMKAATRVIGKAQWGISFTLEDVGATEYMKARGAELVAELNKTTVDDLRSILSQGIEEGWSYDRVAKAIIAKYAAYGAARPQLHIATRAHMIAVTENAMAYGESQLAQARALESAGLPMLKEWGVSADERTCENCMGNAGDGPLPLEDPYSSGDMMTPAHPACRCWDETYLDPAASVPDEAPVFNGEPVNLSLLAAASVPLPPEKEKAA
jgi:hypothetical protein